MVYVSTEEWKHKIELSNCFIESMKEPFTFDTPAMIDFPTKGFIFTIQGNIKRIRIRFGLSVRFIENNYENTNDANKCGSIIERPSFKQQGHTLISISKFNTVFFSWVPKIICQI